MFRNIGSRFIWIGLCTTFSGILPRKRDYEPWDSRRYSLGTKKCKHGHEGRIGKKFGHCAACLQSSLEKAGVTYGDERTALIPSVRLSQAPGREDSPYPNPDIGSDTEGAQNGLHDRRGQTVLICGSREWTDRLAIWDELFKRRNDVELVIHGAARGADTLAGDVARELGLAVREYPADWERYKPVPEFDPETNKRRGNPAGPIRNAQMLRDGAPDLVLAFGEGRGTDGMVALAEKAGVPVVRVS